MEKCCSKCKEIKPLDQFSKHKETIRAWCKKCCSNHNKNYYYSKGLEKEKNRKRLYYLQNKDELGSKSKEYRTNNQDKVKAYYKQYYIQNKDKLRLRKDDINNRVRERYTEDVTFKMSKVLRSRLTEAIKNNQKSGSAVDDLGCTIEELKTHLESKFLPGMSWDNWNHKGWHIDHIRPLSSFNLSDPVQLKLACHFTNLQPLWAFDNLSKSNKIL